MPCWLCTHSEHMAALTRFRLYLKKKGALSLLAANKSSSTVSVTSNGTFMCFRKEPKKWSDLTEATAVSSRLTGIANRHFGCSPFSELDHFRKSCNTVSAGSLTYCGVLTVICFYISLGLLQVMQTINVSRW